MFDFGTLLDVAIGLMFIYIVASLIASAIVEVLETFLRTRAKYLWQGIGELLGETPTGRPREREPTLFGRRLRSEGSESNLPTIESTKVQGRDSGEESRPNSLRERERTDTADDGGQRGKRSKQRGEHGQRAEHMSRIRNQQPAASSHNQATRSVEGQRSAGVSVDALYGHPLVAGLFYGSYGNATSRLMRRQLPPYIPRESFSTAIIDLVSRKHGDDSAGLSSIEALRRGVTKLPPSNLRTALESMMRVTGDDVVLLQRRIEAWYDTSMDTVSGWYKRHAQLMLLLVGSVLAGAANIDSWRIAQTLAHDEPKREALLQAATEFASSQSRTGQTVTQQQMADYVNAAGTSKLFTVSGIDRFSPIGWLVTGFAISLGAPFWFDLLNKYMVVRSTVKPKEKSQDEGSEDRAANSTSSPSRMGPTVFLK